jgi:predicted cupin superfamily sugar epimerase
VKSTCTIWSWPEGFHRVVANRDYHFHAREPEAAGVVRGEADDGGPRELVIGPDGPLHHERGDHRKPESISPVL